MTYMLSEQEYRELKDAAAIAQREAGKEVKKRILRVISRYTHPGNSLQYGSIRSLLDELAAAVEGKTTEPVEMVSQ